MIYVIDACGRLREAVLGPDEQGRGLFQVVVGAGEWMSSILAQAGEFALMGCTVAPGFEFGDFELADLDELERCYPAYRGLFAKFR